MPRCKICRYLGKEIYRKKEQEQIESRDESMLAVLQDQTRSPVWPGEGE